MKTFRHAFLGVCCWVLIVFAAVGQEAASDYIETLSGSKVLGTIVRSFDINQATSITFLDRQGNSQTLFPNDVKGFGLSNGRKFESRPVPGREERGPVFFQVILRGKVSLLSYNGRFFAENEKEFLELPNAMVTREIRGSVVMSRRKQYTGVLNYMLYGPCGVQLQERIAKTSYSESGFIKLIMMYHQCEQLPYELFVEQVPVFRASVVGTVGISWMESLMESSSDRLLHRFDAKHQPFFALGLKLDQWRRMPRMAVDLGIGYSSGTNAVHLELDRQNHRLTATQEYEFRSILVPVFFDYMLFRSRTNEYYVGMGAVVRTHHLTNTLHIIDYRTTFEPIKTELYEAPVYGRELIQFSPSMKVGGHLFYRERWGIVTEVQVEYGTNGYTLSLDNRQATYKQFIGSFMVGFRL
ncbi:MAG: hypothetical protein JJU34_09830 [Lunatimonas sp.]|uniref:hypothetical protein n=1 Tax=Lunatimonas sp. TaxID=2060141 RepID=UPI00263A4C6A|nr:hypothetical protein [Lunatimonas sp.]MCC5937572.1 hypothetical protein [Lunatimonas sp.]